ncbi:MAG: hypothetical protein IPH76_07115 [Xanthomonadales bacterium]|nr:hypothetical protein [Xanthomonadales bacterium]
MINLATLTPAQSEPLVGPPLLSDGTTNVLELLEVTRLQSPSARQPFSLTFTSRTHPAPCSRRFVSRMPIWEIPDLFLVPLPGRTQAARYTRGVQLTRGQPAEK